MLAYIQFYLSGFWGYLALCFIAACAVTGLGAAADLFFINLGHLVIISCLVAIPVTIIANVILVQALKGLADRLFF